MTRLLSQAAAWLRGHGLAARQAVGRAVAPAVDAMRRAARTMAGHARAVAHRHRERLADDPGYARTLTTGATAVVATVVTHPVVVAVLTAGLTAMLAHLPTSPSHRTSYGSAGDYGLADDYDSERAWNPSARPCPAWEIFRD